MMDERNQTLREALSRLLVATTVHRGEQAEAELRVAKTQAAKALVQERAFMGRPWRLDAGDAGFLERWLNLKFGDRRSLKKSTDCSTAS